MLVTLLPMVTLVKPVQPSNAEAPILIVCIQKVSDRSGMKLRDGFASLIH